MSDDLETRIRHALEHSLHELDADTRRRLAAARAHAASPPAPSLRWWWLPAATLPLALIAIMLWPQASPPPDPSLLLETVLEEDADPDLLLTFDLLLAEDADETS